MELTWDTPLVRQWYRLEPAQRGRLLLRMMMMLLMMMMMMMIKSRYHEESLEPARKNTIWFLQSLPVLVILS